MNGIVNTLAEASKEVQRRYGEGKERVLRKIRRKPEAEVEIEAEDYSDPPDEVW